MTIQEIFVISLFGVIGLGVFMFFIMGIVETICTYKRGGKGGRVNE